MRKDVYAQPIGDDFESGGRHGLFDIVVFVWSPVLASCRRWFMPGNSTWPTQSPGRNWAKAEPVIPRADKRTRKTILRTSDLSLGDEKRISRTATDSARYQADVA